MFITKKAFFCLAIISMHVLFAGSGTWTGGAAGDWNTGGNWSGGTVPNGATDIATFDAAPATQEIDLSAPVNLQQIVSSASTELYLSSQSITFNGSGTKVQINSGDFFTDTALSLPTENVDFSSAGDFTIGGGSALTGSPTGLSFFGGGTFIFNISALVDTSIVLRDGGTIQLDGNSTLPNVDQIIGLDAPGTLRLNNSAEVTYPFSTAGSLNFVKQGTGKAILTGSLGAAGTVTISNGTLEGSTSTFGSKDLTNNAAVIFNETVGGVFTNTIDGTGSVEKSGSASLRFSNPSNSYSGGTLISQGKLVLFGSSAGTGAIENNSELELLGGTTATINNNIRGSGVVTKTSTGSYTLSGTNTFSGGTTISGGRLIGNTTSFGSATITNNSELELAISTGTPELTNAITGTGSVIKSGANSLTLSGANNYSGGTTISAGSLVGTSSSLGTGTITNNSDLVFAQTSSGTFGGVIEGTGDLTKSGSGTLTLSNNCTYTGSTTISNGTLSVTGSLANGSAVQVAGGTLTGNGSTGPVTNQSTFTVGLAAGDTFTVNGTYTQSAAGTMNAKLNTSNPTLLSVTGNADLDGALVVDITPGSYTAGTQYTLLTATGGLGDSMMSRAVGTVNGTEFASFTENDPGIFQLTYTATDVIISLVNNAVVTPVALSSLKGNDKAVGNYMFSDANFINATTDLNIVGTAMLNLSADEFKQALINVSPLVKAANPQSSLQSGVQMAVVLDKQFQNTLQNSKSETSKSESHLAQSDNLGENNPNFIPYKERNPCFNNPTTGVFFEPILVYYNQRGVDGSDTDVGQAAFQSYTYGFGTGWEQTFKNKFVLEGGVGYTHSNLDWKSNFGSARWSSIYVAPFFGWFNKRAYANIMVMGTFNFHYTARKIIFTGINRVAKSRYNSYDLLLRANGGIRLPFGQRFWFQPDGTLNYLTVFTEKYTEKGAGSINLELPARTNYILQPSVRAKLIAEFKTERFCYAPKIYVGWLANILLKDDNLSARFVDAPNQTLFNIEGYTGTTNQLILGAEYYMQRWNKYEFSASYELDMLSRFEVHTFKTRLQWFF